MKKHEACYHLHVMMQRARDGIEYSKENMASPDKSDAGKKYEADKIAEYEKHIEALEVAAENLTGGTRCEPAVFGMTTCSA